MVGNDKAATATAPNSRGIEGTADLHKQWGNEELPDSKKFYEDRGSNAPRPEGHVGGNGN